MKRKKSLVPREPGSSLPAVNRGCRLVASSKMVREPGFFASAHLAPHETEIIACRANRGHHFPVNRGCRLVASPKMVREPGFFASAHLLPHETEKSRAARTGVFASVHLAPRQRKKSRVPGAVMMLMYMYAHVYWLGRAIILTNEVGILF